MDITENIINEFESQVKLFAPACTSDEQFKECCEAVLELLKEQQPKIDKLKEPEKLINADKLREKLGFAESCEKCEKNSWHCQRDMYFSEMDFCDRLDIAIEELIQEEDDEQEAQRDYEQSVEYAQYCERYEPTYNPEDGSM